MTTPTTSQLNAWGQACASLKACVALEPSGVSSVKRQRVYQHVGAYLDACADTFSMTPADLYSAIEASAGYTNTGGTGAICS